MELQVIEHQGQRVLTTQQLAQVYETETNNIQKNFANNKDRFIDGRDYFILQGEELKEFKRVLNDIPDPLKFASILYLWTSRGANRHCKILDTDKAWQQFDLLEETYFKVKSGQLAIESLSKLQILEMALESEKQRVELVGKVALLEPKAAFFDAVADSKTAISIGEVAKVLALPGIGRNKMFEILREKKVLMRDNVPYQEYVDRGYFRVVEQKYQVNGEPQVTTKTLVYQRGLDYIRKVVNSGANKP